MDQKLLPAVLISALCFVCIITIMWGLQRVLSRGGYSKAMQTSLFNKTAIGIFAWILLVGVLAAKGVFSDFSKLPPRPLFIILFPLPVLLWIAFSAKGSALLKKVPPHWLIGMQAFRILVELLLWRAFVLQLLPVQMTFEGRNFDVFSGILAVVVAIVIKRKWLPQLVLAYNIIGLLLLLNILVIAVLSMPTPFRYFMNEPSNKVVAEFPFVYLPAVLVVIAYGFHIFSLRQWWLLRKANHDSAKNSK
jgi:hypothetical protein